jgi:hypothetical protein
MTLNDVSTQRCLKYHTDEDGIPLWLRLTVETYNLFMPFSSIAPMDF